MRLGNTWRRFSSLLCLVLLLSAMRLVVHAQTFSLINGRDPVSSLDGLWRFHTGDNPEWASTSFDDSQWPLLRSDQPWTKQGYPNYAGYAWYRFKAQVPDGSKPLSLLLTTIRTGYRVYANGQLIGSKGSSDSTSDPILAVPETILLPTGRVGPQTIQVALRVWYVPIGSAGGALSPGSAIGDAALLTRTLRRERAALSLQFVNSYTYCILAGLVGLTILALFLFRREDREYLWFAILLLGETGDSARDIVAPVSSIPFFLTLMPDLIFSALALIGALLFFSHVLHARKSMGWWVALIGAATMPLSSALYYFQPKWGGVAHAIGLCLVLPACFWIPARLAISAVKKDISARLLLMPAALLYGTYIIDNIANIVLSLGWGRMPSGRTPFTQNPFPIDLLDVIRYIFVFALLLFLVRRFSLARQEEARLSAEMEAARNVQSLLVPVIAPDTPGFVVENAYLPAGEVGGDFFQIRPANDGSLLIVVGDVSGKGVKAAMTVSVIMGALRGCVLRQPAEVLAYLNNVLHGHISGFVTCCVSLISSDGLIATANAGHLSPYKNGKEVAVAAGLPLGMVVESSYEESHFQLAHADQLTFVSDGVVEARNASGELFGFDRTAAISAGSAESIAEAARSFGQDDDITVISVTCAAAGASVSI